MNKTHLSDITFRSLDLPEPILQGIEEAGFSYCTPIQAETLPILLQGKDVSGQAQTGTGKTAAFLIAVFNQLLRYPADEKRRINQPRAVILAPTRELAVQIHKDAVLLNKHLGFRLGLAFGGTGYESQRRELEQGVDVLIGTPGRIIDYFKQQVIDFRAVQVMVLDEADRMFDLGFIKDIRFLLRRMTPAVQRLNLLFSATLSHRVKELAYEHMNNPAVVEIEPEQVTAEQVVESVYYPAKEEKIPLLLGILQQHAVKRGVIFVNTKRAAERIAGYLQGNDYPVALLTGDVPQKKRLSLLRQFTEGELNLLVATDVAARGLHIPEVSHVINYDLPQDMEDYVHRIGRTARAGAKGEAISFACDEYVFSLPDIEEYIGHKIPVVSISSEMLIKPKPPVRIEYQSVRPGKPRGKNPPRNKPGAQREARQDKTTAARPPRKKRTHRPHQARHKGPEQSAPQPTRDRPVSEPAPPAGFFKRLISKLVG